jgi:hypothetical protein
MIHTAVALLLTRHDGPWLIDLACPQWRVKGRRGLLLITELNVSNLLISPLKGNTLWDCTSIKRHGRLHMYAQNAGRRFQDRNGSSEGSKPRPCLPHYIHAWKKDIPHMSMRQTPVMLPQFPAVGFVISCLGKMEGALALLDSNTKFVA